MQLYELVGDSNPEKELVTKKDALKLMGTTTSHRTAICTAIDSLNIRAIRTALCRTPMKSMVPKLKSKMSSGN